MLLKQEGLMLLSAKDGGNAAKTFGIGKKKQLNCKWSLFSAYKLEAGPSH